MYRNFGTLAVHWATIDDFQQEGAVLRSYLASLVLSLLVFAFSASGALAGKSTSDPDKFMHNYYAAIKKATKIVDLMPFYRQEQVAEMDKMKKEVPKGMDVDTLMLEMLKAEQPKEVKIIDKKVEKDRVVYKLEPAKLPPDKQKLKDSGNYTMTGEFIAVKEDGEWKVYKDYWKSKQKDENGSFSSSFGINPDREKESRKASVKTAPKSYDSQFRDVFFKDFSPADSGNVMAALKIGDDGTIQDSHFKSKKPGQEKAVEVIKALVSRAKNLPALPDKYKTKPYVWMHFSWSDKGARAISGPYFDKKYPYWVEEESK